VAKRAMIALMIRLVVPGSIYAYAVRG